MDLTHAVERVEAIRRKFGVESLAPQLAACGEMLRDGGVVDVAVLGQFKAGKSSFLNGLIGAAIVPVDVLPSTAVVTRIGFGPRERVTVHGLGGEPFEVPLSRLAEFVTERGNPANEKRVAVVDVELPVARAVRGIRFVDTPGLGSVFAHNTRVSKEWMPRVGAALVAVSVNHPLSEDDLLLLNDVSSAHPGGGSPDDEGGPGVRGGARLGDRIHPEPGDFPDGEGVEDSPRLQSARLRRDAQRSGGVPAGTDRGAAGGGVRRDRAS